MQLTDKIIWITGASSGIGRALAVALAGEGARLILSGRRREALEETAAQCGGVAMILPFDTTDLGAIPDVVDQAHGWQGRIDGLVNNAGISQRSLAVDTDGMVVAISSVAGRAGVPLRTAYCAAKHGIIGYMDALRAETEVAHGLHIMTVLPGSVATDVAKNALTADGAPQGHSDPQIDGGIPVAECAAEIVVGMKAGTRELIVARGMELDLARLRQSDGDALFGLTAKLGARLAGVEG
jgi:dehydrogenase/reductase SDR family member 7B